MIHPTAVISDTAEVGKNVQIGAYSVIGEHVRIEADCVIGSHVVINGPSNIGKRNRIYQFASIGEDPQDKKFQNDTNSHLQIGDDNVIREYCSINRGTDSGGGLTRLGNHNWIMAYVHIAHDCIVGDHVTFANNTTLAGHVIIEDYVILGGFTGVHQFCRVGRHSFSAISSVIVKDIAPYLMVAGNVAKPNGLNREGLKRFGVSPEIIDKIKKAYKTVYRDGLLLKDAIEKLKEEENDCEELGHFIRFIQQSERGLAR